MLSLPSVLLLSAVLFAIGAYGVIARRNLLVMLMSIELQLNAVNLALAAFSRHFAGGGGAGGLPPGPGVAPGLADSGQMFVLMSMAVAACEVAVGLALLIALFRWKRSVLTDDMAELAG
ncbi:MAG: NADH-quinone oxidoreductase subunit NuoK [Planctomycetota bacterium]|nr:MAG: NADH-quinone oxidoreductase subunit NuoK [Planctomycetota bacterium]